MLFDQVEDVQLRDKVESLKRQLGADSEDLSYKWEAWVVKNSLSGVELDAKTFQQFEADVLDSLSRPKKKSRLNTPRVGRSLTAKTPASSHTRQAPVELPSSPQPELTPSQREAGKIVVEEGIAGELSIPETKLEVMGVEGYKTGHVKVAESTATIDRQIEWFMEELKEIHKISDEDICNPASTTQQESWAIGRIISDKRLGPDSISLQTCRKYGGGTHVLLDPEHLETFSFFPGQLVAFKGTNPNGERFVAKQQYTLQKAIPQGENQDTSVIIAAGPFTSRENLDYLPLVDLVKVANEEKPSALILLGPFVDPAHPKIVCGDVGSAQSLEEVFSQRISPILAGIKSPTVLVPGLGDDVGGHVPFPQPSLAKKRLGVPESIRCMGNPADLSVNGTMFAVTSIDPIQDISRSKYEKGPPSISLPFRHLLDQRSLYPVFPSPRAQIGVDIAHLDRAFLDAVPHILVASSTTRPVVEDFDGVLCVNPGLLYKPSSAGTFAKLWLRAGAGPVTGRYRVEIVQI